MALKIILAVILVISQYSQSCWWLPPGDTVMAIDNKFKEHSIVPDIIQTASKQALEALYGKNEVSFGAILTPTQAKDKPTVLWSADENSLYTLALIDADAPSRQNPVISQIKHWLVINIPGDQVEKGEILADYCSVGPGNGTGLHRYIFLVYKQPEGKISDSKYGFVSSQSGEGRMKWQVEQFADKHKLEGPIAGNFFQAEYDDYVPIAMAPFMSLL